MATYRVDMFCLAEDAPTLNPWYRDNVSHDTGDTFSVNCGPIGTSDITHKAASTTMSETQWADFRNNPPVQVWFYRSTFVRTTRTLRETHNGLVEPPVTPWPWSSSLANMPHASGGGTGLWQIS